MMHSSIDVVILTEDRYVSPKINKPYVQNVLTEDRLVQETLEKKGFKVIRKSWADPAFDWGLTTAIVFRSTWDYFHRYETWQNWLDQVSQQTQLINPIDTIRWNMDKHYLRDLQESGVNIPETTFIEANDPVTLAQLYEETGWEDTILKPCISGAARHTYKLNHNNLAEHEDIFQQLIKSEAMMLQPFQKNVVEKGEISLMVMGGKYTHAVLKIAKPGDFRVQDDFGGTVHQYQPTPEEIRFAEKAVAACKPVPCYARVDVIRDNQGQLAVIELELIEPELWFRLQPDAATALATAIEKVIPN